MEPGCAETHSLYQAGLCLLGAGIKDVYPLVLLIFTESYCDVW